MIRITEVTFIPSWLLAVRKTPRPGQAFRRKQKQNPKAAWKTPIMKNSIWKLMVNHYFVYHDVTCDRPYRPIAGTHQQLSPENIQSALNPHLVVASGTSRFSFTHHSLTFETALSAPQAVASIRRKPRREFQEKSQRR